jgi:hypothetical protein
LLKRGMALVGEVSPGRTTKRRRIDVRNVLKGVAKVAAELQDFWDVV